MMRVIFGVWVALLMAQFAAAQDDAPRFSLTDLRTLGISPQALYRLALAPDGSAVVYPDESQGLCIYHFDSRTTTCTPFPDIIRDEIPATLVWSPDSAIIAFNAGLYGGANNSYMWLFDVHAETFANITGGGVSGMTPPEVNRVDLFPRWDPATEDLYFIRRTERLDVAGQNVEALTLYRLRMADRSVEPVRELTGDIISPTFGGLTEQSISPHGAQIAIEAVNDWSAESQANGVWVIDLDDRTARQIASNSELRVGLPRAYDGAGLFAHSIAWLPDDSGLAIRMVDGTFAPLFREIVVFLDPTSGHIAPLMNFRNFPLNAPYEPDADGNIPFEALPVTGMLSPDGCCYFYLTLTAGEGKVWAVLLEHPGEPMLVGAVEGAWCSPTPLVISEDGARKYLFSISVCGGE